MKQSTPAAPPAAGSPQIVAHPLAANTAKGVTALMLAALVGAAAVGGCVVLEMAAPAVLLVPAVSAAVYGWVLLANTAKERQRFYAQEIRDDTDYNDDGYIGPPTGHVVTVQGEPAFTLPDLNAPRPPRPRPLIHFPIVPNDVLYVVTMTGMGRGGGRRSYRRAKNLRYPDQTDNLFWSRDNARGWHSDLLLSLRILTHSQVQGKSVIAPLPSGTG